MADPALIHDIFNRVVHENILLSASRGILPEVQTIHKFGFNPDVDTAEETVWDAGGLYPWQTAAATVSVVSTDLNDTFGGSGAQTILIQGLDANYDLVEETVQMNGLTPVITTVEFLRIYRMTVPPLVDGGGDPIAGQGNAVGDITASQGAVVRAQILNGNNQTLMTIFTIPRNFTGLLVHGDAGVGTGKDAIIKFYTRPFLGVFNLSYVAELFENSTQRPFVIPQAIPEKYDLDVRAISTSVNVEVSSSFDILLVKNQEAA